MGRIPWWVWAAVGLGGLVMAFSEEKFVEGQESFRSHPYKDIAGHWTIGYGHEMQPGESMLPVSKESARALLESELASIRESVRSMVHVPITRGQREALTDFAFNLGLERLRTSTLLRELNAGNYTAAADQFPRWDHYEDAAGREVVSSDLRRRREAERALFLGEPIERPTA